MKHLALLLAVLTPALALAAGAQRPSQGPESELHKLRDEIAAAKLDRLLNLSREQARQVLPLLKEAQGIHDQLKAEHEKRRPEIARALVLVRDDILRVGQVSDASRKALLDARGDTALKDVREKMRGLHQRVRDALTPEQRERMHEFNPRPIDGDRDEEMGGRGFGGGHHGKGDGRGEGMGHKRNALKTSVSLEFLALTEARAR
jgi:hypothetical protein